jgi:hypothetical protein
VCKTLYHNGFIIVSDSRGTSVFLNNILIGKYATEQAAVDAATTNNIPIYRYPNW